MKFLVSLYIALSSNFLEKECHRCEMPLMNPSYEPIPIPIANMPYKAFYYGKLRPHPEKPLVLFVHGSSGSYQQVRTLGAWIEEKGLPVSGVVAVDFNEEFVAVSSRLLVRQARFVEQVIKGLECESVIVVAHSMGMYVARIAAQSLQGIFLIGISVPHPYVLFALDRKFEDSLSTKAASKEFIVPTGWNDWIAPKCDILPSLPFCWSDPNHRASIWSHCIIRSVVGAIQNFSQRGNTTKADAIIKSSSSSIDDGKIIIYKADFTRPLLTNLKYGTDFKVSTEGCTVRAVPLKSKSVKLAKRFDSTWTPLGTIIEKCPTEYNLVGTGSEDARVFDDLYYEPFSMRQYLTDKSVVEPAPFITQDLFGIEHSLIPSLSEGIITVFKIGNLGKCHFIQFDREYPFIDSKGNASIVTHRGSNFTAYCSEQILTTIEVDYLETVLRNLNTHRTRIVHILFLLLFTISSTMTAIVLYGFAILINLVNLTRKWSAGYLLIEWPCFIEPFLIAYCHRFDPKLKFIPIVYALVHFGRLWAIRDALLLDALIRFTFK